MPLPISRLAVAATLALTLTPFLSMPALAERAALAWLEAAHESLEAGAPDDAIEQAEKALDLDPGPELTTEAHYVIGRGWLDQAVPEKPGGKWQRWDLQRAEKAFDQAIVAGGSRSLDAKANLAYAIVIQETIAGRQKATRYADGLRLAHERFAEGSPGPGLDLARFVLCGSPSCEPVPAKIDNERFASVVDTKLVHPQLLEEEEGDFQLAKKPSEAPIEGFDLARRYNVRGKVVIQVIIDETGRVANARVVGGLPFGLNELAVESVEKWRFEPATLDGEPVSSYFNLAITYR